MLIEIMAQAWSQYRQGLVYALQHNDFDSAIYYLHGMIAMLPDKNRPKLGEVPKVESLEHDFKNRAAKWRWLNENGFAVEDSISKWIHNNFNAANFGLAMSLDDSKPPTEDAIYDNAVENIKDLDFDEGDEVKVENVQLKNYDALITTYPWNSPRGPKRIPVPVRWHPDAVVKNVVNHNKNSGGYTGVVQIGMCLVAGSKVVMADGSIRNIENLGQDHGESINHAIRISENNTDFADTFYKYDNRQTIEIITSGGKSVRGTTNHPLLVKRNGMTEWVELKDIKLGDELQTIDFIQCNIQKMAPTNFESVFKFANQTNRYRAKGLTKTSKLGPAYLGKIPPYVSAELASLMGYIIGDGWVRSNDRGVGFVVAQDEIDLLPILREYGHMVFGIKPHIRSIKPKNGMIKGRTIKRSQSTIHINYNSKPVARMLSILKPKRVPEMILCSPNPILAKFLSWYFEADGSCVNFKTAHRRIITVDLTSINVDLLRDVQIALLRFGIQSKIKQRNKNDNSYKLTITRKESLVKFFAHIGFQSIKKRKQAAIALNQVMQKSHQNTKYQEIVTDIKIHQEPVTVYDISVPKSHQFITNGGIISHNSGSGKTTITKMIIHKIHEMGENYVVRWFTGHDLLNVDKIIDSCVVGVPHILIFDDASYTLQNAKRDQVARLANALTTIRHKIKARVITIMNIHYSKAMLKFFRNQHFTILVSVTPEEMGNYAELFKEYMGHIRGFAKLYRNMLLRGYFRIPIDSFTGEYITYTTNQPFRVAMVAEITDLHPMVYARERCDQCDPLLAEKQLKSVPETMEELYEKYGDGEVRTAAAFFATIHGGKNWLPKRHKAIWMHLNELARNGIMDYQAMMDYCEETRKRGPDKRPKNTKQIRKQSVKDLLEDIKEENLHPEAYKARKEAEQKQLENDIKMDQIRQLLKSPKFDKKEESENNQDDGLDNSDHAVIPDEEKDDTSE